MCCVGRGRPCWLTPDLTPGMLQRPNDLVNQIRGIASRAASQVPDMPKVQLPQLFLARWYGPPGSLPIDQTDGLRGDQPGFVIGKGLRCTWRYRAKCELLLATIPSSQYFQIRPFPGVRMGIPAMKAIAAEAFGCVVQVASWPLVKTGPCTVSLSFTPPTPPPLASR